SHDDVAKVLFKVLQVARQAQDRHYFGSNGDVETGFTRIAVRHTAERAHDRTQGAVVHVHDAAPGDAAAVDAERVAPVDVIVDQGRQQVVRRRDRVEVTGEVQVHFV